MSTSLITPLVFCALATIGGAQITNGVPAVIGFVDVPEAAVDVSRSLRCFGPR